MQSLRGSRTALVTHIACSYIAAPARTWNAYVGLRHGFLLLVTRLPWEKFEISIICVGASRSFPSPPPLHYLSCAPGAAHQGILSFIAGTIPLKSLDTVTYVTTSQTNQYNKLSVSI